MKKIMILTLLTTTLALNAQAHCQIPCGIYDDAVRFTLMREHVTTIEKSMKQINRLAPDGSNQRVRWINNKERHADELTKIVTHYFLTQRIKGTEPTEKYTAQLTLLHRVMLQAMKTKQTTELEHVNMLRKLIDEFEKVYTEK